MGITMPKQIDPTSGGNFAPIPADNHRAVCVGIIDLGTHLESYQGKPARPVHKVKIQWELVDEMRDDGKTQIISRMFNIGFGDRSHFAKLLKSWFGSEWLEVIRGQPLKILLGRAAMVNVVHSEPGADGRIWANVDSVTRLPKGMQAPEPTRDFFYLDLDGDLLPEALSYRDAERIRQSQEYKSRAFNDQAPMEPPNGAADPNLPPAGAGGPVDDDIPY